MAKNVKKATSMRGFFLRVTGKKSHGHLYYRFSREGVSMTLWTGINVDVKEWTEAIQKPAAWSAYTSEEKVTDDKGNVTFKETDGSRVKRMMDDVIACVNRLIKDGEKDKKMYQLSIDGIVSHESYEREQKAEVDNLNHVRAFYDYFVSGIESGLIKHHEGKRYTDNSIRVWKGFSNVIYATCSEHLTFDAIDKFFVDKFYLYLEKQDYFGTTMNHKISLMRKLCALAAEYGKNNNAYSVSAWKKKTIERTEKKTAIYLTDEEIDAMYNLKLTGTMEQVRDMFFIGCLTCQRYSDYSRLTKANFKTNNDGIPVIALVQMKTKIYVEIPIVDDRIWAICEKYNYKFPHILWSTAEDNIKKIARELAKTVPSMNELYTTKITKVEKKAEERYPELLKKKQRGEKMSESEQVALNYFLRYRTCIDGVHVWERDDEGNILKPKFALISTHTARRSGITNMYKTGLFDTKELRSMSGHQSDEMLDLYIKVGISEQSSKIYDKLTKLKNHNTDKAKVYRIAK